MLRYIVLILSFSAIGTASAAELGGAAVNDTLWTISYGDVSTDIEDASTDASGSRINLSYETGKKGDNFLHGLSLAYLSSTADVTIASQTSNYRLESLPIYYAPKWLFGKKSLKGFVRGAFGMHLSRYERRGDLPDVNVSDLGVYLGISAGAMFMFSQKWFANIEYEWAYLSNSYYRDGAVGSAMIGLGFRY